MHLSLQADPVHLAETVSTKHFVVALHNLIMPLVMIPIQQMARQDLTHTLHGNWLVAAEVLMAAVVLAAVVVLKAVSAETFHLVPVQIQSGTD
jgi:uncharacterized membrane protein